MFGQINPTEFDITFAIFGIPVRIHVSFWIGAAVIAWLITQFQDMSLAIASILIVLFSILCHELGHALMSRKFGWNSQIVLHATGGYATTIPMSHGKNILVTLAGPLSNFILASILFGLMGVMMVANADMGETPVGILVNQSLYIAISINIVWGIFNLLPVYPMDGGSIVRELMVWWMPRNGLRYSLYISLILAVLLCALGLSMRAIFISLFMAQFAFMNYQELQRFSIGPRRRF